MTVLDNVVDPAGDEVAAEISVLHGHLARQRHLRPGPRVDALFGDLVRLAVTTPPADDPPVVDDPAIRPLRPSLQHLCAEGEHHLEHHWSHRIAAAADPNAELARFPYAANYRRLTRLELDVLAGATPRPVRRVLFAGSGPLPLSPLLLAAGLDAPVDGLDRDRDAVRAGRDLAGALGADRLSLREGDVLDADVSGYDLVVLAALVGATPADKHAVLSHLARSMTPGAMLLARSARGTRTLLYPALDVDGLDGFALQAVVHPVDEVVNSVVVARARAGR